MGDEWDDAPTADDGETLLPPDEPQEPPAKDDAAPAPHRASGEVQAEIAAIEADAKYWNGDPVLVDRVLHLRRLALGADNQILTVLDDALGSRPPTEADTAPPEGVPIPLDVAQLARVTGRTVDPVSFQADAQAAVQAGVPPEEIQNGLETLWAMASPRELSAAEMDKGFDRLMDALEAKHGEAQATQLVEQAIAVAHRLGIAPWAAARGVLHNPQVIEALADLQGYYANRKVVVRFR